MSRFLFANRYQAGDVIGRGTMSEVYRGEDKLVGRDVAIKVLRADLARDPSFQARFRREAKNAAALNHPAIVAVYDTGERETAAGAIPFIVMEYVAGQTLQDKLAGRQPLPVPRSLEIAGEILAALDFSHRRGIVHRDIKPANVMIAKDGEVKVMDFGVARQEGDGPANTTATTVIGSAQYLSPEQARGGTGDARSDLYATGCVLYEMLCGTPPFTDRSALAVASRHIREAPRAPSEIRRDLPREIDAIVLKSLSKNPVNRYQTAAEMRADVSRALAGQAVRATPVLSELERDELMSMSAAGVGAARAGKPERAAGSGPMSHDAPLLAPVLTLPELPADPKMPDPEAVDRAKHRWRMFTLGAAGVAIVVALWLTLMVILAPPPPAAVAVPDLTGMSLSQATAKLQEKQLTLGTVTSVDTRDGKPGTIANQRPSGQTQVDQNTPVNVEIEVP
jgi:serine/threonine-protein kinase